MPGVFNSFARDSRPLSQHLSQTFGRQLQESLVALGYDDLCELTRADVVGLIAGLRPAPPSLGGARPASVKENGGARRRRAGGVQVPTTRHYVAVLVRGSHELLEWWPDDEAYGSLLPVDADFIDALGGLHTLSSQDQEIVSEYWERSFEWTLDLVGLDVVPQTWALHTYVDLTNEEEAEVAANEGPDLSELFRRRQEAIRPVVEAVAEQTQRYFDETLPASAMEWVESRQRVLGNRRIVTQSLSFPDDWKIEPPRMVVDHNEDQAQEPEDLAESPSAEQVVTLQIRRKLDPASFDDVQRVIRTWADSIERYPRAINPLDEDPISDLLAATLNATLPSASREVYTRGGKSDIFIQADVLSPGAAPAKIFICETKKATSKKVVVEALDPQLFSYLTVRDTSAVLLLLFGQRDFLAARTKYLRWLREDVTGFRRESASAVEDWPIYTYRSEGRTFDVCVASVTCSSR